MTTIPLMNAVIPLSVKGHIGSCSGTVCTIECATECLPEETYYAVVALVDIVGFETIYYTMID